MSSIYGLVENINIVSDAIHMYHLSDGILNQPNGLPVLNSDGDLVGPILPRVIPVDSDIIPNLNEIVVISDTDNFQIRIGDGVSELGVFPAGYTIESNSTIIVSHQGTDTNSGNLLRNAYTAAKSLTPGGAALSLTNRGCLLIYPGVYNLSTTPLTLDSQYIDIVGMGDTPSNIIITSNISDVNSGTIIHTADYVSISGITIKNTGTSAQSLDDTDPAAYFPSTSLANIKLNNVIFEGTSSLWPMRIGIDYSGTFTNCISKSYSFGYKGAASGSFDTCVVSDYSFGSQGTASGYFIDCNGGYGCFAGEVSAVDASGTFINCAAKSNSFGGNDASGSFSYCVSSDFSFGGNSFSGVATHCTAGNYSFGYGGDSLSGKLYFCRLLAGTYRTVTGSGITRYCLDGSDVANNQG